jgi:O-antigen/teichoic acid export membrane protein
MMGESRKTVVDSASRSVKWIVLGIVIPRFLTPVVVTILASLLSPEAFGVVAIAQVISAAAQLVLGLGWGQAVIRTKENPYQLASIALWISISISVVLYGIIYAIAPALAVMYQNPLLEPVVRVASLSIIFHSITGVVLSLLEREMRFQQVFYARVSQVLVSNIVALGLALFGGGVWALVIGPVCGAFVESLLAITLAKWLPTIYFSRRIALKLVSFSGWVILASFLQWVLIYADNALAGWFLGTEQLGVYVFGWNLAGLLPSALAGGVVQIAYPAFSKLIEDPAEVGRALLDLQAVFSAVLFPICLGIGLIAIPVLNMIYGTKWQHLGEVVAILSFMGLLLHLWTIADSAYRAIGKPYIWPMLILILLLFAVPVMLSFGRMGLIAYVLTRTAVMIPYPIISVLAVRHVFKISIIEQISAILPAFLASLLMFVVDMALMWTLGTLIAPQWTHILALVTVGFMTYGFFLFIINRTLFFRLLRSLQRIMPASGLRL